MVGEWKALRLGGACLKIGSGATPRGGKEAYKGGATALIRSQNIYNDGFHRAGIAYIDDNQSSELKNVEVKPNDVLLNITGDSVARCCQVAEDVLPARVNQHVSIIRPQPEQLDACFLRYVLVSNECQQHLLSLASAGATRPALTKSMIENLDIPCPPLPTQKRIAHILGTLDDKIELNRKMNETLEGMARALFQSWFSDFDPVRRNMNRAQSRPSPPAPLPLGEGGRRPGEGAACGLVPSNGNPTAPDFHRLENSAQKVPLTGKNAEKSSIDWKTTPPDVPSTGKDPAADFQSLDPAAIAELDALFPDSFVESELGPIPKGWEVVRLDDALILQRGFDLPSSKRKPGKYVVMAASGPSGYHDEYMVKGPGVTTGRSGVLGKVYFVHGDFWPLNTSLWVKDFKRVSPTYALHLLRGLDFELFNAGSAVPSLNRNHVHNLPVVMPPKSAVDFFDAHMMPLIKRQYENDAQSRTLAALRDTLLPKLLSGEIEVKEYESLLEPAT